LICRPDDSEVFLAKLKQVGPVTVQKESIEELSPLIEGVVAWQVPDDILDRLPKLRWIQTTSSGADHLDPFLNRYDRPLIVSTVKGMNADAVAEFTLMAILAQKWRLAVMLAQHKSRVWKGLSAVPSNQCACAILGMGEIGTRLANHVRALGMRVLGVRRTRQPHPAADEVFAMADLETVLPQADFVVLAVPLTKDTTDLIGARELTWMKPSAYLINVSRGAVVDEDALVNALQHRIIAGALLDVTRTEPCPPDSPLWQAPGLVITPHIAGQRSDYSEAAAEIWADNVRRFAKGETPQPLYQPAGAR